jgi:hypothetical protein
MAVDAAVKTFSLYVPRSSDRLPNSTSFRFSINDWMLG